MFSSVLPGDPNYISTIKAFEAIGCLKAAKTIEESVCLFPDCEPPTDKRQRIHCYEEQPEEIRIRLDADLWTELDSITSSLARYIKENRLDKTYL